MTGKFFAKRRELQGWLNSPTADRDLERLAQQGTDLGGTLTNCYSVKVGYWGGTTTSQIGLEIAAKVMAHAAYPEGSAAKLQR